MAGKLDTDMDDITPGMEVEASDGDLGDDDVSKPRVSEVVRDANNNIAMVKVKKGLLFSKEIDVPVGRIEGIENTTDGKNPETRVMIQTDEAELEALTAGGTQTLGGGLRDTPQPSDDFLDKAQRTFPTPEGLADLETANVVRPANDTQAAKKERLRLTPLFIMRSIGPGFLAGMSGNDSSAVTTYAIDGASNGYGHLWLLLLSTPLYQAVIYACGKIGRVSQKGLAEILREYYSRPVAGIASLLLLVSNVALIAADLLAIGTGFELITGISWVWWVVPVALVLWYFTVYRNFDSLKKIFIVLSLAFVTYIVTAVLSGAHWGDVLTNTFVPYLDFGFSSISSAVALLGATFSPYSMVWEVQGEKEEKRPGTKRQQIVLAFFDSLSGTVSGNIVAYFIIVCTSATLFANHQTINTAADAARSLEPLLGPAAKYLFAVGLIGSGLVAVPVLLASASYAISGTFGLPASLSKKPWQSEGFYLILTLALLAGLAVAFIGGNPISLIFWANILAAVLAPILLVYIIMIGNNRKIMGHRRLHIVTNICLVLAVLVLVAGSGLLFYGIVTGQNN